MQDKNKENEESKNRAFYDKAFNQIFPQNNSHVNWDNLELKDEELNDFELFYISEFNIKSDEKEIDKFINERYQTILSACYFSNISVATIFSSKKGNTNIYIGLRYEDVNKNDREVFRSIGTQSQ